MATTMSIALTDKPPVECYGRRSDLQLPSSADYVMENLDRYAAPDFIPNCESPPVAAVGVLVQCLCVCVLCCAEPMLSLRCACACAVPVLCCVLCSDLFSRLVLS